MLKFLNYFNNFKEVPVPAQGDFAIVGIESYIFCNGEWIEV